MVLATGASRCDSYAISICMYIPIVAHESTFNFGSKCFFHLEGQLLGSFQSRRRMPTPILYSTALDTNTSAREDFLRHIFAR